VRIRSVTLGIDATWPPGREVEQAGRFLREARARFEDRGVVVQSVRLALSPFAELEAGSGPGSAVRMARDLEAACRAQEIGYVSLGPVRWSRLGGAAQAYADALPELVAATELVFVAVETAADRVVHGPAARAAGRVIARIARETPLGFGNLRFCTIAECPPNIPFFPAAYHGGGPPRFSLALEAADLVREALGSAGSPAELERRLGVALGGAVRGLDEVARGLEAELGVAYAGTDLTPAPFPTPEISVGGMLEDLGVDAVGAAGTLAAAATLTRMLKALPLRQVGFSGLMLPVLEDSILAARASEGLLSWSELLLYSAVCGTGLDTIPLPGDAGEDELAAIVLDVAALAVALAKPLTCRLLPVPGKQAGEMTEYDFPFFANARVLSLKGRGSSRLFARLGE
jgi:uncharacterized protein (UPF0210 family)